MNTKTSTATVLKCEAVDAYPDGVRCDRVATRSLDVFRNAHAGSHESYCDKHAQVVRDNSQIEVVNDLSVPRA